jgi:hypothetical protein
MSLFPLYDELFDITEKSSYTSSMSWKSIAPKISQLTEKQMEILYCLIYSHYIKENKNISDKKKFIPYKGKLMDSNRGALFNISDLPQRLELIIAAYLNIIL